VTYDGWPLYTFTGDAEAGETNGQGLNDVWFVVAPDGTPVGAPEAEVAADVADDSDEAPGGEAGQAGADVGGGEDMAALMKEGAAVFSRICAACHGPNGNESLVEHAAILADNSRLENETRILRRVIHGNGYMPAFGDVLS